MTVGNARGAETTQPALFNQRGRVNWLMEGVIMSISTRESAAVDQQFQALATQWKTETALLSSTTSMVAHPAYRAIIGLGERVVPLLLRELQREPAHWFEALKAITGEDPVPREQWGNVPAMAAAWLSWGRSRGLI
jgi:hypothetical protein